MSRERFCKWGSVLLIGCVTLGCGSSDNSGDTDDASTSAALEPYAGTWRAGEPLLRDPAMDAVAEAVRMTRPEYSVAEIKDFFASQQDVDYTRLRVDGSSFSFLDDTTTLCAAQYKLQVAAEASGGGAGDAEPATQSFELSMKTTGDCSEYALLTLAAIEPNGHFHIVNGTEAKPQHSAPWSPSAWPLSTTPESFAEAAMAAVPYFSTALPEK